MAISSIFERDEYKPYEKAWQARQKELKLRSGYYDGSVFGKSKEAFGFLMPRLYGGIKPLYLPLARAVDVDAGIIPGGWEFPEDDPKSETWAKARDTVFDWSNWDTDGVLYVHYGAQYGVSGLRISDYREQKMVLVQPTDPMLFMLIGMKAYDATPDMAIMIEKRQGENGEYEYSEVITPDKVKTYKDGAPYGYDGRDPEYKNELGFVPYVEVRHKETGKSLGEATFQTTIPMLNEVNELGSFLADVIKKNVDAQWAVMGAEPSDLRAGGDEVWFLPAGADVKPLIPGVDIDGVLNFIKEIAANVKESLPELAFDDLRSKTQIATATLELQLMELVLKIKRTRPNYDKGLKVALQMAGRAAKTMNLSEIALLDDDELRFDDERDILPSNEEDLIRLDMLRMERDQLMSMSIAEGEDA